MNQFTVLPINFDFFRSPIFQNKIIIFVLCLLLLSQFRIYSLKKVTAGPNNPGNLNGIGKTLILECSKTIFKLLKQVWKAIVV